MRVLLDVVGWSKYSRLKYFYYIYNCDVIVVVNCFYYREC